MPNIPSETVELFDKNAEKSVAHTDDMIEEGIYLRGTLFVRSVSRQLPTGSRVLDYGCGPGRITRMIAEAGYCVHGIDPAPKRIRVAKEQLLGELAISFSVLSGFGEELKTGAYDAIVCSSVIEFVDAPALLLSNFKRALRPGGFLMISFANRISLYRAYAKWRFGKKAAHFAVQKNLWSPSECRTALTSVGFKNVGVEAYFEPPFMGARTCLPKWIGCFVGTLGLVIATHSVGGVWPY